MQTTNFRLPEADWVVVRIALPASDHCGISDNNLLNTQAEANGDCAQLRFLRLERQE